MSARITTTINIESADVRVECATSRADPTTHIVWIDSGATLIFSLSKMREMHETLGAYLEARRNEDLDALDESEVRIEDTWVYPPERSVAA